MVYFYIALDNTRILKFNNYYIKPNDPAVIPTAKKKENSNKSLGNELTINLI